MATEPSAVTHARSIGIVGGMSPESTTAYYRKIVALHEKRFGDHSYPRIVIVSVSFQRYIEWQHGGDWKRIGAELQLEFERVADAGADFAILATNTMHKVLPSIRSPIPVLSILDAVAAAAKSASVRTVALTGTQFTMTDGFYQAGLETRGLRVLLPDSSSQEFIHKVIYDHLIYGRVPPDAVVRFAACSEQMIRRGADTMLLACTELEMLATTTFPVPVLNSTDIHAEAAWRMAIGDLSI